MNLFQPHNCYQCLGETDSFKGALGICCYETEALFYTVGPEGTAMQAKG